MKLKRQKILAIVMSLVLVISTIPASAFAEGDNPTESPKVEQNGAGDSSQDNDASTDNLSTDDTNINSMENDLTQQDEQAGEEAIQEESDIATILQNEEEVVSDVLPQESAVIQEGTGGSTTIFVPTISYKIHNKNVSWQNWVTNGATAGGKGNQIDAIEINVPSTSNIGELKHSTFTNTSGWTNEKKGNGVAGTFGNGEGKVIEAIKIDLENQDIDVYYRVYISELGGWLGWAKNGARAGSSYGYAIEAIQIKLVGPQDTAPASSGAAYETLKLKYSTHVQNVGWQASKYDGQNAGTTGRSLRIEALKIELRPGAGYSGGVSYESHVQNIGWQNPVADGAISGTAGQSLRVEAIKIRLTGDIANYYDIYYRVHVQNIGWLNWASNGEASGTENSSLRIEAIQIKLVRKGGIAPSGSGISFYEKTTVSYNSYVQGIGWQGIKTSGALSGTTGKAKRIEALKMTLNSSISGGISYTTHVQSKGWLTAKSNGEISGTEGQSLRVEAITVRLTGEAAKYYDVYYRVHSQGYGWLGWAKNGEKAGTSTCSYRVEAIQVIVVAKGGIAPGTTSGAYKTQPVEPALPASYKKMNSRVSGKSSSTGWLISIDTTNCILGVYRGSKGNWTRVYTWSCGPGASSSPTVLGTFKVQGKGYSFGSGFTCYYWTQFYGNYLMHSVLYDQGTRNVMDGTLGRRVSHGCVRLDINNAKWIYDYIPTGTTVYTYD